MSSVFNRSTSGIFKIGSIYILTFLTTKNICICRELPEDIWVVFEKKGNDVCPRVPKLLVGLSIYGELVTAPMVVYRKYCVPPNGIANLVLENKEL